MDNVGKETENEVATQEEAVNTPSDSLDNGTEKEVSSGTAPDNSSDNAPEKVTYTPEQQKHINALIAAKVEERNQEREARRLAEQEAEKLRSQLPQAQRPVVPDFPDSLDPNFDAKVEEWKKAQAEAAKYDAEAAQTDARKAEEKKQRQNEQLQNIEKVISTYDKRAKNLGIDPSELTVAGEVMKQAGVNPQLVWHLLNDEKGPALTMHLVKNPIVREEVLSMDPVSAGIYLETKVKPKLAGSNTTTNAPDPAESLNGAGTSASGGLDDIGWEAV